MDHSGSMYVDESSRQPYSTFADRHLRQSRAMFRPQFSRELINDLESVENALQLFYQTLGEVDQGRWTGYVDVVPSVYRMILDTSTEFL